ncbi:MAG TPA: radical SAM protein, partial [Calditrichaeota bacterium]|nr:radical SAM protein [Calditrichota bacterium]
MRQHIINLTRPEIETYLEGINQPRYRIDQIYKGIYVKNWDTFEAFTTLPKELRSQLSDKFVLRSFTLVDEIISPMDNTTKYLWELSDGKRIESVTIYEGKRVTFCISSQVGCPLDCKFCATGKMGLLRNLTVGEIVEQVLQMKARAEKKATNIVFMGMGEPLLNYETVIRAADILADPEGLCFNRKK